MNSTFRLVQGLVISLLCLGTPAHPQFTTPQAPTGSLRDLAILKPPPGARVAIVVFEDLGCPHCAAAHPIELQVAQKYHVPLVRFDSPIRSHVWTFQGAVDARYVQEKYGRPAAEDFRGDLFKAQMSIAGIDDVQRFTRNWLQAHGKQMPMLIDADGSLAQQVNADLETGHKINVSWTPTILVVTPARQQVIMGADGTSGTPEEIAPAVQAALAQPVSAHPAAAASKAHAK